MGFPGLLCYENSCTCSDTLSLQTKLITKMKRIEVLSCAMIISPGFSHSVTYVLPLIMAVHSNNYGPMSGCFKTGLGLIKGVHIGEFTVP